MSLSERKQKILKAVIDDYISYAEPVGSSHIAKNHELTLSSATIRNELAELEEGGYLQKTHTSSGRVPSNLGYRTYVDDLMEREVVSLRDIELLRDRMQQEINQLDKYIKSVLEAASKHTNLTAVALAPDFRKGTIQKIELMMLDPKNILIILVTASSIVKSKHIRLKFEVDTEFIKELKIKLNEYIAGNTIEEIIEKNFEDITVRLNNDHGAVQEILEFVYSTVCEINESEMYVSGETNMLTHPEFKDVAKAKDFLDLVHDKKKMKDIIIPNINKELLKVLIGDEIAEEKDMELSLVISPYRISDSAYGAIGFIGPTRMDYRKAVSSLDYISKTLNESLERNE